MDKGLFLEREFVAIVSCQFGLETNSLWRGL